MCTNYAARGQVHYQMGDYEAALQDYARAIELQPDRAFFYSERAAIHRELGHDLNAALQDYNRAIELAPQEGDLFYRRGRAHRSMGNHEAALEDYARAIELQPNSVTNYAARGQVHYQMGDYEAALQDNNRAIELAPQEGDLFYRRCAERIAAWAITRRRWRTMPVPSSCSRTGLSSTASGRPSTANWVTT